MYNTLVLPSVFFWFRLFFLSFWLVVGEITQGRFLLNILVLPSLNRNLILHFLMGLILGVIFVHFIWCQFYDYFRVTSDTQWRGPCRGPYTMYIYSLRAFLTTKGALIDGDWGGVKNWSKSQKRCQNFTKIIKNHKTWSKKVIKNE